jgi:hypothetical protein
MAGACRIVFVVSLVGVDAVVSGSRIMTNIAGGWGLVRSHLITSRCRGDQKTSTFIMKWINYVQVR